LYVKKAAEMTYVGKKRPKNVDEIDGRQALNANGEYIKTPCHKLLPKLIIPILVLFLPLLIVKI